MAAQRRILVVSDIRLAVRGLRRRPGFGIVAVGTLALAIGANTAIFSVLQAVLLRPLPYHAPERLVTVNHLYPSLDLEALVSVPGFVDYRDRTNRFAGVAVEAGWAPNLTGLAEPMRLVGARVSGLYFSTLGVAPAAGRTILPEDDAPGRHLVVVISDGFWQRQLGGRDAVGETLVLDDERHEIVGVMPRDFRDFFNRDVEIWRPVAFTPEQLAGGRTNEFLSLTARLAPGVSVDQAAVEMRALAERLKQDYPGSYPPDWSLGVETLDRRATEAIRPALLVLLGAVGFVLLIACANLANLLLARAASQTHEVAVRNALGASRARLVRQLLTESLVLAVAGGALGLVAAAWGVRVLARLGTSGVPWAPDVTIDATVAAFTLTLSLATGVVFGAVPALQLSGARPSASLREGRRGALSDRRSHRIRKALVVVEVGLALMLLVGAGLLLRSFARVQAVDPGFRPDRVMAAQVVLPATRYPSGTSPGFFDAVRERLVAVPGVSAAGATSELPFGGGWSTGSFRVEGYDPPPGTPSPWGDLRVVTPGFAAAIGLRLVTGRFLTDRDREETPPVVVVDEEMVRRYWPDASPIGKRITRDFADDGPPTWIEVVGVVGHTKHEGLDGEDRVQLYFPHRQVPLASMWLAVRATGDPTALVPAVRSAVAAVDPNQPVSRITTMTTLIDRSLGQRRLAMLLLGLFAATAVLLASVGLYGVLSYGVTERAPEIGLRMALGAARFQVIALVVGLGMRLVVVGLVAGLAGAFALTGLLASQLYAIEPTDPLTFVGVVVLLLAVAAVAMLLPALRATRVAPADVLRAA